MSNKDDVVDKSDNLVILSKNLRRTITIPINLTDRLCCQICNEEIAAGEKIYFSGMGKLGHTEPGWELSISDINVSHLDCMTEKTKAEH